MSYSKQGVNYGIGALPIAKIEADLTYLRQHFDFIRITYPAFNQSQTSIDYWKDVCVRAKQKGFFVMWGIYCPTAEIKNWYKFIQTFIELAPWAAANGIVFGVNESLHGDPTVVPQTTQIADLHAAAKIAKLNSPNVKLHISLMDVELDPFIQVSGTGAAGRGAFDFICLNQYDTVANYKANIDKLTNAYGSSTRVTEFNTGRGFDPAFGDEASWKATVKEMADYNQAKPMQAFFIYTYDHNPEGNGKWNFRTGQNPETQHDAFDLFRKP